MTQNPSTKSTCIVLWRANCKYVSTGSEQDQIIPTLSQSEGTRNDNIRTTAMRNMWRPILDHLYFDIGD